MKQNETASELFARECLRETTIRILKDRAWDIVCRPGREGCLDFIFKWTSPTGTNVEVEWEPALTAIEDSFYDYEMSYINDCECNCDDTILYQLDSTIGALTDLRNEIGRTLTATDFKQGDRVALVKMEDPFRDAPIGMTGTVTGVAPKPINVVNVDWDNGFSLNPCLDEDVICHH